jgi:hypothetical protein
MEAAVEPGDGLHAYPSGLRTPVIRQMRAEVRGDALVLRGSFEPFDTKLRRPYDPCRSGGWILQLFMNTDQAPTGYPWMGVDYLVRGSEVRPDGGFVVRRVDPGDEFPGGWGPESGTAKFAQQPQDFTLTVPLASIGGDEGMLDFVLETYVTVACPECEGGVTHEWAGDFFGSTSARRIRADGLATVDVAWLSRDQAVRSGRFGSLLAAATKTRAEAGSRLHEDTAAR